MKLFNISWIYENGDAGSTKVVAANGWDAKQKIFLQFIGGRVPRITIKEIEVTK